MQTKNERRAEQRRRPNAAEIDGVASTCGEARTGLADRRSTAAPVAEPVSACGHEVTTGPWIIRFNDADRADEIFTFHSNAIARWNQISTSWNADLFVRIRRNYNDQNDI